MTKLYSTTEISKVLSVAPETVKHWEEMRLIPLAERMGLQHKRVWSEWKVERILEFARDNGYRILDIGIIPQHLLERGDNGDNPD